MDDLAASIMKFNEEITEWTESKPKRAAQRFAQKLARYGLKAMVKRTPVKTGRARGGWQVVVGDEAAVELPEDHLDPDGNETIQAGLEIIRSAPPYELINFVNLVPYLLFLENGSSAQAPSGMIAITYEELLSMIPDQEDEND